MADLGLKEEDDEQVKPKVKKEEPKEESSEEAEGNPRESFCFVCLPSLLQVPAKCLTSKTLNYHLVFRNISQ